MVFWHLPSRCRTDTYRRLHGFLDGTAPPRAYGDGMIDFLDIEAAYHRERAQQDMRAIKGHPDLRAVRFQPPLFSIRAILEQWILRGERFLAPLGLTQRLGRQLR